MDLENRSLCLQISDRGYITQIVAYNEGMMSPCHFRAPDAGRRMTSFTWLTPDKTVQCSSFGKGIMITVNLGNEDYREGGRLLPPGGYRIDRPSQDA